MSQLNVDVIHCLIFQNSCMMFDDFINIPDWLLENASYNFLSPITCKQWISIVLYSINFIVHILKFLS